jgi:hypothetical protein
VWQSGYLHFGRACYLVTSTLKIIAIYYSESLITTCKTTWFHSPEDGLNHILVTDDVSTPWIIQHRMRLQKDNEKLMFRITGFLDFVHRPVF